VTAILLSEDIRRTGTVTGATLERWSDAAAELERTQQALAAAKSMLSGYIQSDESWELSKRHLEQIEHGAAVPS
jgi:type II secretory pathway pseudopilin PulG